MSEIRKLVDEEKFVNGSFIDLKKFLNEYEEELIRREKNSVYLEDMNRKPTFGEFIEFLIKTGVNNPKGRYLIFDVDGYGEYNIGGMGDFILRIDNLDDFMNALSTLSEMKYRNSLECFDLETNTNTELNYIQSKGK